MLLDKIIFKRETGLVFEQIDYIFQEDSKGNNRECSVT